MATMFVVTETALEKGGARFSSVKALTVKSTREQAKQFVEELIKDRLDGMTSDPWTPVKWTVEGDQEYAVDIEDFSDFSMFTVDPVEV